MARKKAAVALSGGKDSAAAGLLLREQGLAVTALHMRLGLAGETARLEKVRALADCLRLPLLEVDLQRQFRRLVIDHFLAEYRSGRTPNPCIVCNRLLKFGLLRAWWRAREKSAVFATGHYAALCQREGRFFLGEPRERRKSQIYFLAQLGPKKLAGVTFPLAERTLAEVRELTRALPLVNVRASQDACFLQGEGLAQFLRRHIPQGFVPGAILNVAGKKIGEHEGVLPFTVGQRRGTRFAAGSRWYVLAVDTAGNTVTLGPGEHLLAREIVVNAPVYWRKVAAGERLLVKIRSTHAGEEAQVKEINRQFIRALFASPVRAITPGQYGVFYDGDVIVAAGVIAGSKK